MTKDEKIKECYISVLQRAMNLFPNGAPSPKDQTRIRPFQDLVSAAFLATGLKPETVKSIVAYVVEGGDERPAMNYTPVFLQLIKVTSSKQSDEDLKTDMVLAHQNGLITAAREAMLAHKLILTDFIQLIADDRRREIA